MLPCQKDTASPGFIMMTSASCLNGGNRGNSSHLEGGPAVLAFLPFILTSWSHRLCKT